METRELIKTTTEQERELIKGVLERARQKQKERGGDDLEPSLNSHGN